VEILQAAMPSQPHDKVWFSFSFHSYEQLVLVEPELSPHGSTGRAPEVNAPEAMLNKDLNHKSLPRK
jgi:hypothetical protein